MIESKFFSVVYGLSLGDKSFSENYNLHRQNITNSSILNFFFFFFFFYPQFLPLKVEKKLFLPWSHHSFWFRFPWKELDRGALTPGGGGGGGGGTRYVKVMGRLRGIDPPFSRHWEKM